MQETIIDGSKSNWSQFFRELFQFKDLFWVLAYRDFKARYAQTFLGVFWSILQPLASLLIFILIFDKVAEIDTGSTPYPLFCFAGISAWSYFAFVVGNAGTSLVQAQSMIKKIYFPRIIIPFSKAALGLIDLMISLSIMGILMIYYQVGLEMQVLYFPFFLFLALLCGLTGGIWLSALTVRYRDFQQAIPFILQMGMFATPVGYPSSLVPENLKLIFYCNPMAGVVDGFRWTLTNGPPPTSYSFFSYILLLVLFLTGVYYFRKVELEVADII